MKRSFIPTASAVLALAAVATCSNAQELAEPYRGPSLAGQVYVNLRTGERTITFSSEPTRSERIPRFVNEDFVSNGNFYFGLDNPTRIGLELVSWGDIEFDSAIDAFSIAYVTDIAAPMPGPFVPGLDMTTWWCDCDHKTNDPNMVPLWNIVINDLAGVPPGETGAGYIYVVDLDGSGLEFEIGDTDGSFIGITGQSSTGCDQDDQDGTPLADFSWSYRFHQNQSGPLGSIGPRLVLPQHAAVVEDDIFPTGANGIARGVPDRMDLFRNPANGTHEEFLATIWVGGWPFSPYASAFMGLYAKDGPDCSIANYNNDAEVDILDLLDFFDDFGPCENQPAPCGSISDADLTGDTIVDILDFLEFFEYFGSCS